MHRNLTTKRLFSLKKKMLTLRKYGTCQSNLTTDEIYKNSIPNIKILYMWITYGNDEVYKV